MSPIFSIITVTFNASSTIKPTLASISEQTFTNYEYIVMAGKSTDNTLYIVKESGINNMTIVSEKDNGLYDAMNKAMKLAKGEYIIFLNAGDSFSDNDALHKIADTAKRTHADIIYGQTQLVDENRNVIGMRHLTEPSNLNFRSFKNGMLVCHQAFIARRKIAQD